MDRRWVQIENIQFIDRMRKVDEAKAREIADSILENGLMNPPAVRFVEEMTIDGELNANVPVLIAGRHRLRALEMLGETAVECSVYDVTEDEAIIMEADENLARHEIKGAARIRALLAREEAWARKNKERSESSVENCNTGNVGYKKPPPAKKQFATDTAEKAGVDRTLVWRLLDVGKKIGAQNLARLENTSMDTDVEIVAFAGLASEAQEELLTAAESGRKVSARLRAAPVREDNALEEILRSAVDTYGREAVYGVFQVFKMNPRQAVKIADRLFAA